MGNIIFLGAKAIVLGGLGMISLWKGCDAMWDCDKAIKDRKKAKPEFD